MFKLQLCQHPTKRSQHPTLIADWLDLIAQNKAASVHRMIDMTRDLRQHGRKSRYVKHLGGPIYELKTRTPQGGARVYFFRTNTESFVLVRAEVKRENNADTTILDDVAEIIHAFAIGNLTLIPPLEEQP